METVSWSDGRAEMQISWRGDDRSACGAAPGARTGGRPVSGALLRLAFQAILYTIMPVSS